MGVIKPYYLNQNGWTSDDYYGLHRYLHRLFLHYDKKKEEIQSMDISRMTDETKVLIYCILKYYSMNDLMQLDNLKSLVDCAPLKTPLVLGNHSIKSVTVYNDMNVMLWGEYSWKY